MTDDLIARLFRERLGEYARRFNFDMEHGPTKMMALAFTWQDECEALRAALSAARQREDALREALRRVVAESDRDTDAYIHARAALAAQVKP